MNIYFLGIGGAGVAPLALLTHLRGDNVAGADQIENEKVAHLRTYGISIYIGHKEDNLPINTQLVVYSSAIPVDNPERIEAKNRNIPQISRGEYLAKFSSLYHNVIAISGSHGKTSTTALLSRMLEVSGFKPGFLIGAGIINGTSEALGEGYKYFITEVDESDGSHTLMYPSLGIITNIETDHSWSVGGEVALYNNFRKFGFQSKKLICIDSNVTRKLFADHPNVSFLSSVNTFGNLYGFQAQNSYVAAQAAIYLGCEQSLPVRVAQTMYPQVARRSQVRFSSSELVVIEDYAHHPTEVSCFINWLRNCYPKYHLRVVFQPHRYARLKQFFNEFVHELSQADSVVITPVFAAWSESGSVDGLALANAIHGVYSSGSWCTITKEVFNCPERPLVIAVLGAGDVDEIFNYMNHFICQTD